MNEENPDQSNIDEHNDGGENRENAGKTSLVFQLPERASHKFTTSNQPTPEQKSHGWWKKRKGRVLFQAIMQLPANGTNMVEDKKHPGEYVDQLALVRRQAAVYFNMPESLITVEMLAFMKQVAVAVQKNDTFAFNTIMDQSYGRPKPMEQFEEVEKPAINIFLGPTKTDSVAGDDTKPMEDAREDVPPISNSENDVKI